VLPIALGARTATPDAPAQAPAQAPSTAAPATPATEATGTVRGTVRDPRGQAIAGALAVAPDQGEATTDASGRFALEITAGRPVALHASAEGFGPSRARELSVEAEEELEVELVLTAEAILRGTVLDLEGRPDVDVQVHLGTLRGDPRITGTQITGPAGEFEFRCLAAGTYLVIAEDPESHTQAQALRLRQVVLVAGETAEVVLGGALGAELGLTLRVTLGGEPFDRGEAILIPEARDVARGVQTAQLDAGGLAEFRVPPGRYLVNLARHDGTAAPPILRTVEVAPPSTVLEIALPSGSLAGLVIGPSGPLADCPVALVCEGTRNPLVLGPDPSVKTDAGGAFAFEGLEAGRYSLRAPCARPLLDIGLAPDARVGGLVLKQETTGRLRGRVLGPDGAPQSGAGVHARGPLGRWLTPWASASSRVETGAFELADLPPGDYTLCARHGELASPESQPVTIEAGKTGDVELRLAPGAFLRLALVESDGTPAASAGFQVFDALDRSCGELRTVHDLELLLAEGLAPSTRAIGPLFPGDYRVEARGPDGRQASALRALAPGWNELVLRLP
jgi:hypothetical protein